MKDITKHTGLIKKMAMQAARQCGILDEFEDVYQEAWVAACEALRRYNPEKAQLSTYLGNAVFYRVLKYYGSRENLYSLPENYDIADPAGNPAEWALWYGELRPREKEMVDHVFTTAEKRTAIIKRFAHHWGWRAAEQTAAGIRNKLQEVLV